MPCNSRQNDKYRVQTGNFCYFFSQFPYFLIHCHEHTHTHVYALTSVSPWPPSSPPGSEAAAPLACMELLHMHMWWLLLLRTDELLGRALRPTAHPSRQCCSQETMFTSQLGQVTHSLTPGCPNSGCPCLPFLNGDADILPLWLTNEKS